MFSSPVSIRLSSGTSRTVVPRRMSSTGAHADVDLVDAQRLRRERGLDRIGQVIVEPRLHLAHELAEAQHHAELVGLDAEEAGKAPQHDGDERDQRDAAAAEIARQQGCAACPGRGAGILRDRAASARRAIAAPSPTVPAAPNPTGRRRIDCSTASISPRTPAQRRPLVAGVIGERTAPYNAQLCRAGRPQFGVNCAFVGNESERGFVLGAPARAHRARFHATPSDRWPGKCASPSTRLCTG